MTTEVQANGMVYKDHYSEYEGAFLTLHLYKPWKVDAEVRGKAISADATGIKLEIRGRTKLYHNFYTWAHIAEVVFVVGRIDKDGDVTDDEETPKAKPRRKKRKLAKPAPQVKAEVEDEELDDDGSDGDGEEEDDEEVGDEDQEEAPKPKASVKKKVQAPPVLKGRAKTDVLLGTLITEGEDL